jgi:hypothetical protein
MIFGLAQKELAGEVTKTEADAGTLLKIKKALNYGKQQVSAYCHWRNLQVPNNELLLIPQYTTGNATVTLDSRMVTLGGGGVVSTAFKGRFFKGQKSRNSYEIIDVDTTANTLTLKTAVIEESGTYTYSIVKVWYRVPSDCRIVLPNEEYDDLPIPFEIHGYDDYYANYSVPISVIQDSNIMTGSGFLDNVFPGDYVKVGDNIYHIRQVQSDTSILMTNKALKTLSGTYTFSSDTPYKARVAGFPSSFNGFIISGDSGKSVLNYSYIRMLYDMVNDNDTSELPLNFDRAIMDFAKAEYKRATNTDGWEKDLNLGQNRLQKLELNRDLVWESHAEFNPLIRSGMGRGNYPRSGY